MDFMMMYPDASGTEVSMLDAGRVADVARAVEAAGIKGLAFTEHPAPSESWLTHGGHQSLDPFVALAAAASVTEQIRLLTFLTVVPYRNPMLLANLGHDLNAYSKGRFNLGLGTQISAHITKRFSMPWSHPAPPVRRCGPGADSG